jgi:hypothetical protein
MTEERTIPERSRLEINYVQVVASALAAISSAVLLSTVGVAGTIIGAAIGSVFATAGSAIYSYSIRLSHERVARAQAAAFARMQAARVGVLTRPMGRPDAGEADSPDQAAPPVEKEPPAWREALRRLPWKWIALIAVGVFVVAMILILCFELIVGRSVSQITGGTKDTGHRTSIPGLGSSKPAHTPTPTPTPSSSPTQPTTSVSPSAGTSTSPSPAARARQSATTAAPSAPATPTPTPTPTPSATVSSTPTSSATSSATPSP